VAKIIKSNDETAVGYLSYERDTLLTPPSPEDISEEAAVHEAEHLPDPAEILAEARAEAEEKVREAFAEGYRRGEERGLADFREKVGESAKIFEEAAAALAEEQDAFLSSVEPEVVDLVGEVASRILLRESQIDGALVASTVRAALKVLLDRQRTSLRVNPADLETLRAHKAEILQAFEDIEHLHVEESDDVSRGGCVAESETMVVDATLETQLRNVLDTMLE
jgi:flagellar assembly protein FliH